MVFQSVLSISWKLTTKYNTIGFDPSQFEATWIETPIVNSYQAA